MGKVKSYLQFINEGKSGYPEGYLEKNPHAPSEETMKKVMGSHDPEDFEDDEVTAPVVGEEKGLIQSEPILQNLISKEIISYQDGEVTYKRGDTKTEEILKGYFSSIK